MLCSVIESLGATVKSIVVSDLKNDTFYATVVLNVDGKQIEVDSRPSDAIALAVRMEVPIYAEEAVMDKAGIVLEQENEKSLSGKTGESGEPKAEKKEPKKNLSEEEIKKMSAFNDFLKTLDLEDFNKRQS